jgi:hypothetical protein
MKGEEIDRRIAMLEQDLAGQAGTIEQRRIKIKEEISGIKVAARKDLERFVEEVGRQIPNVIDSAKSEDLKQYLPAFLEDAFKQWAEKETTEIAAQLEALTEKTIALVREDAHDASKRVAEVLGTEHKRLDVQIDTFAYDVGVVGLLVGGLGVMLINPILGAVLAVSGPILALVLKGRVEGEFKKRARELAPEVLKQAQEKVAPKLDEMIDEFARKLDAWVVSAGEELHREVLEVLRATKGARGAGAEGEEKAKAEVEALATRLATSTKRLEEMRGALWTPKDNKVRIADQVATP